MMADQPMAKTKKDTKSVKKALKATARSAPDAGKGRVSHSSAMSRDEAEAQASSERRNASPIRFVGGFENATSHTPEAILAHLQIRGIPEPAFLGGSPDRRDWSDDQWWIAVRDFLRYDEAAWVEFRNLFDRARFFTVVPMTIREEDAP